jgi:hypothetical protein
MTPRWIAIGVTAAALMLTPFTGEAQKGAGGGMGPGMRGDTGATRGGMGMGGMMQMQGMMQQMQGMMQHMADMLKSGTVSPEQMKRMGELMEQMRQMKRMGDLMEQMSSQMGQAHDMMSGMGAGGREPRAMHEQMSRMQQHMADMQKHMAEMMGGTPSASPHPSTDKK